MHIILGIFAFLIAFAFVVTGVVWVFMNFWWLIVPGLIGFLIFWLRSRPGAKAYRAMKVAMKNGNRMSEDITSATARTTAEMNRIANEWKRR